MTEKDRKQSIRHRSLPPLTLFSRNAQPPTEFDNAEVEREAIAPFTFYSTFSLPVLLTLSLPFLSFGPIK